MSGDEQRAASSNGSSSTPPTSNTDAASMTSNISFEPESGVSKGGRVGRVRTSTGNYNEQVLYRTARRRLPKPSAGDSCRSVSGETLVPGAFEVQRQLVQDSIQMLNMDWNVDAVPGDEIREAAPRLQAVKRRTSTRLNLLDRASTVIGKTKSVLGKRSRDAVGASKDRIQDLSRRASLRPRLEGIVVVEGPPKKKVRMSDCPAPKNESSTTKQDTPAPDLKRKPIERSKIKRWLSHGLYVGQDPDFDPRLTESKNKLKRASTGSQPISRRNPSMPFPMFAGHRIIEMGRNFRLPFDVFSPLPPGQPKPEEWRKTQKNVFVGDSAEYWKKSKRLEHSTCICEASSGCDENCFNRFMFYECDDNNCNIGSEHCTNRSFEDLRQRCKAGGKYNVGVEVIKTTDRGYGVRSNRTFGPNQIIVEYTGEIITQDECDTRMRKMYKDNECFYLMIFDQNMIIDATRGSIARFINHSCEPNCKMIKWTVAGKPRMALFAGDAGVMTGEELTYDYNFDPFSSKNIQECRCGAPSCRGVLGPRPKDEKPNKQKDAKDALNPIINIGTKRKLQQAFSDTVKAVANKQRRLSMPLPVKSTINSINRHASTYLTSARVLASSEASNARLVKKASERSLRSVRGPQTAQKSKLQINRRATVARTKRRLSNGTFVKESVVSEIILHQRNSPKTAPVSMRRNVVRTIKGAYRSAGGGKSIRVVGD